MRFSENDDVVQAIPTYGTDEPFTKGILPRASRRRFDFLDANRLNPLLKLFAVYPVTIAKKVPRLTVVREGVDNLISGPAGGRMVRYVEMCYSPAIMGQNNEDKQDPKSCGGNQEKVDGNQVFDMIVQESAPCLGRRFSLFRHQPGYRPFRDLDSKFQQFAVDSGTSPGWIRIGHFADEIADFAARCWSPGVMF